MFIIVNQDEAVGYYTGHGWDTDEKQAKEFASAELAQAVIIKHGMKAEAVEVQHTDDLDAPKN